MKAEKNIPLKFKVSKLGAVEQGKFVQKPLTIFCGPNNSGKTWTMYSLYHFYTWLENLHQYEQKHEKSLFGTSMANFNKGVSDTLDRAFNIQEGSLTDATFEIQASEEDWERLKKEDSKDIFLMPAERSGLNLIYRELGTHRTKLLHHASKKNVDLKKLLRNVIHSPYAEPIADYIDWLFRLPEYKGSKGLLFKEYALELTRTLAGGAYKVDFNDESIKFRPHKKRGVSTKGALLGLHECSSAAKSLFGLWFYLKYQAKKDDVLMIDEPELNIHPENQRKVARLLARLVNAGLNVVISTHSDYIVREFNSLIMLSQAQGKGLLKKHKYKENEVLTEAQIGAYLFDKGKIEPFEVNKTDGIYATTFDQVIDDLNKVNNDIYYELKRQADEKRTSKNV